MESGGPMDSHSFKMFWGRQAESGMNKLLKNQTRRNWQEMYMFSFAGSLRPPEEAFAHIQLKLACFDMF